jgi:hypothetical protein
MARPLALGPDDPAFAPMELNRLAFKEAIGLARRYVDPFQQGQAPVLDLEGTAA